MDAFGPATIPHTSKHVPLLSKDVSSKVFTSLFPLAHVTHGNEVTLINPNGVNLKEYEMKLDEQIAKYWDRLSRLAWSAIPEEWLFGLAATECEEEEEEPSYKEGKGPKEGRGTSAPSYKEHRDQLRQTLAECNWPRPQEDFDLLEEEINLGRNFKKYLKALKSEAKRSGFGVRKTEPALHDSSSEGELVM